MALIDLCSLIDNLFVDSVHDKSLLTEWEEAGIGGYGDLLYMQGMRDLAFEEDLRLTRNKLAAHLDRDEDIQASLLRYFSLDLERVHRYFRLFVDGFYAACSKDIRTKIFLLHDTSITCMEEISGDGMLYDDSDR